MARKDWLALVAVHSDTWLLAVAFYHGARLNKEGRDRLFELINDHPTCYEVLSGRGVPAAGKRRGAPGASPVGGKAKPPTQRGGGRAYDYEGVGAEYDDGYGDGGGGGEEGDPCPNCGRFYREGEFWIACDVCDAW